LDELTEEPWQVQSASQDEAVLSYTLDDAQLKIVKHFSLVKAPQEAVDDATYQAYHLKLDVRVENLDAENAANIAYRLQGPTGLPLEGWWYINKLHPSHFSAAGVRDVTWRQAGGGHYLYRGPVIVSDYENEETTSLFTSGEPVPLEYAGVDTQYFNCSIIAASEDKEQIPKFSRGFATVVGKVDDLNSRRTDVTFRLISRAEQIPAGGTLSHSFTIFAGPKKPELLAEYGLGDAVVYGWFFFVTKPLLWLLHLFYAIIPNYGIAIILLTVLVRACMTPISRKAAMNAAKMQELAPEMKQIAEKYQEDMEKRMRAQRELFAKHNYHPLSGCSLMFLQLPIFIGLYRGLSVDIELRQAPLIPGIPWASNLAAPDQLFRWDGLWETLPHLLQFGTENGMLGPYFNLLPCLTIALFMIQQKLFTPPPTDDQQAANQKVMKFMMIFIGLLFFRVPSGLCLYFIVSSMWGIAERKLLPPPTKGETPPPEKKKKEKKGEGTMDKLRAWAQSKVDAASQKSTQKSTQTSRNGESERERRKARRKQKRR